MVSNLLGYSTVLAFPILKQIKLIWQSEGLNPKHVESNLSLFEFQSWIWSCVIMQISKNLEKTKYSFAVELGFWFGWFELGLVDLGCVDLNIRLD